jgi:hypothetical protein
MMLRTSVLTGCLLALVAGFGGFAEERGTGWSPTARVWSRAEAGSILG